MSARLFSLRNVPDDEAEEIRQLLASNAVEFCEDARRQMGDIALTDRASSRTLRIWGRSD